MSSIPPPPSAYANYPRADAGAVERLDKLVAGYFGMNQAVLANLAMLIGLNVLSAFVKGDAAIILLPLLLVIPIVLFFVSRPHVAKIGEGLGWTSGQVNGYCVLISLFFWFCFGVIGFGIVQGKAMTGLKEMGFQGGGLFTSKKKIMAFVEEFKSKAAQAPASQHFSM